MSTAMQSCLKGRLVYTTQKSSSQQFMCLKVLKNTFPHRGKIVQTHWFSLQFKENSLWIAEDVRAVRIEQMQLTFWVAFQLCCQFCFKNATRNECISIVFENPLKSLIFRCLKFHAPNQFISGQESSIVRIGRMNATFWSKFRTL